MNIRKIIGAMDDLNELIRVYYDALHNTDYKKPRQNFHEKFVTVYGRNYCPYCQRAHALVENKPDAVYIELEEGFTARSEAHTPHIETAKTIPIVFINDDYLGGLDELTKLFDQ
jgi:glutaredoxin